MALFAFKIDKKNVYSLHQSCLTSLRVAAKCAFVKKKGNCASLLLKWTE